MAITIIKDFTSGKWYPSSNPINCTVDSNNSGNCNFRYICDVYVNGIKIYTSKLFPDPTSGYGFFQIGRILNDYIETKIDLSPNSELMYAGASSTAPSSVLDVTCKFGEEYDNTSTCTGDVKQYTSLKTSKSFKVYETAIDYEDFPTYTYTDYMTFGTSSGGKYLTNSPKEVDVTYNDSYYLDMITTLSMTSQHTLVINTTKVDGTTESFTYLAPSISSPDRVRISIGPYDINRYFNTPVISQFVKKYTVTWNYIGDQFMETWTFNVKKPKEHQTRIGFIGLKGSPETFTFYNRNTKFYDYERKVYDRLLQSNNAGEWKYNVGDRGVKVYGVRARESHSVTTFCSKDISEWLYEMWLSPEVWVFKRPELIPFRVFREDGTSDSRMLFWLPDNHTIETGDTILCFPDTNYIDYNDQFTVTSVEGNIVDCGLTYNIYNVTESACGWIQKEEDWKMLPVVISNNNRIEVKQRKERPIEYSLDYSMSYTKNTLMG